MIPRFYSDHPLRTGIVENKWIAGGKVRQRHVVYLGEINASQERSWRKSIEVLDENAYHPRSLTLCATSGAHRAAVRQGAPDLGDGPGHSKRRSTLLLVIDVAEEEASFTYKPSRDKLRRVRQREGRYLLGPT